MARAVVEAAMTMFLLSLGKTNSPLEFVPDEVAIYHLDPIA
jgi:hypothetical protein